MDKLIERIDSMTEQQQQQQQQLPYDELIKEYKNVLHRNKQLTIHDEQMKQELYELKRNYELKNNNLIYLTQEFDQLTTEKSTELISIEKKYNLELTEQLNQFQLEKNSLIGTIDEQKSLIIKLENELIDRDTKLMTINFGTQKNTENLEQFRDVCKQLENDNFKLLSQIDAMQQQLTKSNTKLIQYEVEIENLNDKLSCIEENLQQKKTELNDCKDLLETNQDKLMEVSGELSAIKKMVTSQSQSDDDLLHSKKGHSLFAEVDDQRQKMKNILTAQVKYCNETKKLYDDSQFEIRRLKREHLGIQKELRICNDIFLKSDEYHRDILSKRIAQQHNDYKKLEEKLQWTEKQLFDVCKCKGAVSLEGILSYCKNETNELKEQLNSCRLQKSTSDELYSMSERQLAKWRFETLRLRCIIKDRELLLEENHISIGNNRSKAIDMKMNNLIGIENEKPNLIIDEKNHDFPKSILIEKNWNKSKNQLQLWKQPEQQQGQQQRNDKPTVKFCEMMVDSSAMGSKTTASTATTSTNLISKTTASTNLISSAATANTLNMDKKVDKTNKSSTSSNTIRKSSSSSSSSSGIVKRIVVHSKSHK